MGKSKNKDSALRMLRKMSAESAATVLKDEHAQTIALVLSLIGGDKAARIVGKFNERLSNDVALRMATIDHVDRRWMDVLERGLSDAIREEKARAILRFSPLGETPRMMLRMNDADRWRIIDNVREYDPWLAQTIIDAMMPFRNIRRLPDDTARKVFKEAGVKSLSTAFSGSGKKWITFVCDRLDEEDREAFLAARDERKPKNRDVERNEIMKIVYRLLDEDEVDMRIFIKRRRKANGTSSHD